MINFRPKIKVNSRRKFLRQLGLGCGSILFIQACAGKDSSWRFFSENEAQTIIAFAEQIIPADQDPGATDANVINFIDKQLVGYYIRFQDNYRKGIYAIERSSKKMFQKTFYELGWNEQVTFMEQMELGKLPEEFWKEIDQRSFFNMLLDHSMQGFYGSPRHGGNKNYMSYKMIHLDYPHVLGQNRYSSEE
jgi:gluconate 2-dehydrogenase gamma chain